MTAWGLLVVADALAYRFIRSKGVTETGDEPPYLIVARALSHLTVHPLAAYEADIRTRSLYNWPPRTPITDLSLQLYAGPRGPVSNHPIGLSVLLAPFVAVGGAALARLGLMAILAAGFVYVLHRTARLVGLSRRATGALLIVAAAPALWLAATQIYPDLLTGVLIAVVAVDVATLERDRVLGWPALTVSTLSLAVLPWLHQQDLVPAVLLVVAYLLLGRRAGWLGVGTLAVLFTAAFGPSERSGDNRARTGPGRGRDDSELPERRGTRRPGCGAAGTTLTIYQVMLAKIAN